MTSRSDNGFCNMVCWAIAALAGLLAAILLIYYGTWSSAGGIAVGVVLFAVLGWLLSWLLCGIWADETDAMAHEMEVRRRTGATGAGSMAAGAAAAGVAGVAAAGAAAASTASTAAGTVTGSDDAAAAAARQQAADEAAAAERQRAAAAEAERKSAADAEAERQRMAAAEAEKKRAADAEAERQRAAAAAQEKAAAAERQSAADAERKRAAEEAAALKARQQEETAAQARADAAAARARLDSTSTSSAVGGGAAASGLGAGAVAGAAAASGTSRGTKPAGISGPRAGGADDLKVIKGVGPKMENMLHGMGYYHYDQIADWKQGEVDWVDDNLEGFKGRVTRDQWVPQAKILAGGGHIDEDAWAEGRVIAGTGAAAAPKKAAAPKAAASAGTTSRGTKPSGLSGPRAGGADDLKVIKGVGPQMETMLHGMGYYHYDQIGNWKQGEVDWVDDNLEGFKGRVTRDQWVPQAKILAGGGRIDEAAWSAGRVEADGSFTADYDGDGVREGKNEGTRPEALSGPRGGKADNLKEIKGVGPKMEKLLWSLGFYHFDQVASWSSDEVAWVDANLEGFKGRVSRDEWVKQAKILADGGATEFSKRVDKGGVY